MELEHLSPNNQNKIYGFEPEINELINLYNNNQLPNKIIFTGPKGIGKCTLAYHLINYIFSQNEELKYNVDDSKIDLLNRSYNLVKNNTHPNFHLIDLNDDKKNIEISQIRQMINYTYKSTFDNKERIILIDNIESLNLNSLNALLKVVEEPNEKTIFILIFDNNTNVLETLKSRCLKFNFSLSSKKSLEISNKILNDDVRNYLDEELFYHYQTPGDLINLINFSRLIKLDLKNIDLKNFLLFLIDNNYYKTNKFVKNNIYKYIELYLLKLAMTAEFKKKTSLIYHETIQKINEMKKFNLDQDSIFINLKSKLFNG